MLDTAIFIQALGGGWWHRIDAALLVKPKHPVLAKWMSLCIFSSRIWESRIGAQLATFTVKAEMLPNAPGPR